jgi:hypothetical protein
MDNQEEVNSPLKTHKTIDWIGYSETLIPTYSERLIRYIEKHDNKLDESDFIEDEIQEIEVRLMPKNRFTVGKNWTIFKKSINAYLKFLVNRQKSITETEQQGKKTYATNSERLYAIQTLCPEFVKLLSNSGLSKIQQGEILSLITNVNPTDCYKETFTIKKGKVNDEFKDKIKEFYSLIVK